LELKELPKRVLLAAGFVVYLSQAPEDLRQSCLTNWREALGVGQFEMRRFLCTESEQLIWKSEGLPSDDLSVENAIVILQVRCLVITAHIRFITLLYSRYYSLST